MFDQYEDAVTYAFHHEPSVRRLAELLTWREAAILRLHFISGKTVETIADFAIVEPIVIIDTISAALDTLKANGVINNKEATA